MVFSVIRFYGINTRTLSVLGNGLLQINCAMSYNIWLYEVHKIVLDESSTAITVCFKCCFWWK